jgi:hypothetical protein
VAFIKSIAAEAFWPSPSLASVFWYARGIIFIDYLEKGQTINNEYSIAAPFEKKAVSSRQLHELDYELLPHPPYSPDLSPSDFFLFAETSKESLLERNLALMKKELIAETAAYFEAMSKSYYKNGIKKLYDHCNRFNALEKNYTE